MAFTPLLRSWASKARLTRIVRSDSIRAAGRAEGTVLFGIGRVSSGQCAIGCIQGSGTPTRALHFLNTPTPQPRQHGQTAQNGNLVKALYLASTNNLLECPDVDCE